jgi:hypothetical protein
MHTTKFLTFLLACLAFCAPSAFAQTDPSLTQRKWSQKEHIADTFDEPVFIFGGHVKGPADEKIDTLYYDSYGRVKIDKTDDTPNVYFGYRILSIGIDSSINALPTGMNDISIVGAYRVGDINEDMSLSIMAGAGQANDNHFDNNHAYYAIGAATFTNKLDEHSRIHWGIGFEGNRVLMPDVPLPYISYEAEVSDKLTLLVGVPRSKIIWKPFERWTFEAKYFFPIDAGASVTYDITEEWKVFGLYDQSFNGVFLNDQEDNRLFYQLRRVQAGVRFIKGDWLDVSGGLGWAFDQDYRTGWDIRNTGSVATPSDNMLVFIRLQGTF